MFICVLAHCIIFPFYAIAERTKENEKTARVRTDVVREVDAFMPHLRLLFSIWVAPLVRKEKAKKENKMVLKAVQGRSVVTDGIQAPVLTLPLTLEDSESGERDDPKSPKNVGLSAEEKVVEKNRLHGKSDIPKSLTFQPYSVSESKTIQLEGINCSTRDDSDSSKKGKELPSKFQSLLESMSVDLVFILVGRVSFVSSLRFSLVDAMYLSSAILKVRAMKIKFIH